MSLHPALERDRSRLLELLRERSFARRKVVLSSGRESDFYVDCKQTTLSAEGHYLTGRLLHALVRAHAPEAVAVGGLTLGADPLASAVSLTSFLSGWPLEGFIVRKEPKGHGTERFLEGRLPPGAKVAVLEDVVTSGASTLRAIERVEAEGHSVQGAFALVDRLEGGREAVEAEGKSLYALFTRHDFIPEGS